MSSKSLADRRGVLLPLPVAASAGTTALDAIVQHRTGTKAQITAIVDAPVGEIAAPTDEASLMVRRAGSWVTVGGSGGGGATQIVDTTGTVTGAIAATVADNATAVHVKIPDVSSADITLTLPAAATVGTVISFTGDALLAANKTVAINSPTADPFTGLTSVTAFNPVERVTVGLVQIADFSTTGPALSWVVLEREQLVALVDDVAINEGNVPFSDNSFGLAGGIVRGLSPSTSAAIGKGAIAFASRSLAIGPEAQVGNSVNNGTGTLAVGTHGGSGATTAMPNSMKVLYDNSIGIGTPNEDNRETTYLRVGSHCVAHNFALRRTSVGAAATELFLFGTSFNNVSSPTGTNSSNRFTFVRNGIYTFEMDGIVRIPGTANAYFIQKRFSVLKDATAGVAIIGTPEVIGAPQKNGFPANITADPFSFSLGGTGNVNLICTFDAQAATDGNMTVQACFRGFIALA